MEHRDLYGEGAGGTGRVEYAGFGVRLVAYLIDGLILSVILGVLSFATGTEYGPGIVRVIYSPGSLLGLIISVAYFVYFETSRHQGTIGKIAMGLKVTDTNYRPLTPATSLLRYFGKIISAIIFMIGYIMVIFDDKRRALHDRLAGTYVIEK